MEKNLSVKYFVLLCLLMFLPLATLTSYFEEYGEITALTLKKNPFNGKSKQVNNYNHIDEDK